MDWHRTLNLGTVSPPEGFPANAGFLTVDVEYNDAKDSISFAFHVDDALASCANVIDLLNSGRLGKSGSVLLADINAVLEFIITYGFKWYQYATERQLSIFVSEFIRLNDVDAAIEVVKNSDYYVDSGHIFGNKLDSVPEIPRYDLRFIFYFDGEGDSWSDVDGANLLVAPDKSAFLSALLFKE